MPDINAIEQFKQLINQLANEPAVLEERGLEIEDVSPPESKVDENLEQLLNEVGGSDGEEEADMDSLLSGFNEEGADAEEPESDETGSREEPEDELDNLGLDDFELGTEELDDTGSDDLSSDFGLGDLPELADDDLGDDDSGLDDFDDLGDMGGLDDLPDLSDDDAGTDDSGLDDLDDFDDLGDMGGLDDLPDLSDDDTGTDDSGLDDFDDLGDMGGLDDLPDLGDDDTGSDDSGLGDTDLDDLGDMDDLSNLGSAGLDGEDAELGDLSDLDGLSDISGDEMDDLSDGMEDLGGADEAEVPDLDDMPNLESAMDSLEQQDLSNDEESEESIEDELNEDFLDGMDFDEESSQFSIDEFGDEYNLDDEESTSTQDLGAEIQSLESEVKDEIDDDNIDDLNVSDEDLLKIQRTLNSYPLNLKIYIEERFADPEFSGSHFLSLYESVKRGAGAKTVADLLLRLTGKKIKLPKGYEKKSGRDEEEKSSGFLFYFRTQSWPLLRRITLGLVAAWLLFLGAFTFIYRPLQARSYYNKGLEEIAQDRYDSAEEFFDKGFFGWYIGPLKVKGVVSKHWFYDYADAYKDRLAFLKAAEKYETLLTLFPDDKEGLLRYVDILSNYLSEYAKAERVLNRILEDNSLDLQALYASGDNYYLWADSDPSKLERARKAYATIVSEYGSLDEVQLRFARYFMKKGEKETFFRLVELFKKQKKFDADEAFLAQVFGEIAGYLIDNQRLEDARFFLEKGSEARVNTPEIHYQFARYYRLVKNKEREKKALSSVLGYLVREPVITKRNLFLRVDTYRRMGDLYAEEGNLVEAESQYGLAIENYEKGEKRNLLEPRIEVGQLYGAMGDINYFTKSQYGIALHYFTRAREMGYKVPEMSYKIGYIHYLDEEYDSALKDFFRASRAFPHNVSVKYAMANTFVKQGDLHAAEGTYRELLKELDRITETFTFFVPEEKAAHRALVENYVQIHNNLGVALYSLSEKTGDKELYTEALYHFTRSSDYSDVLVRGGKEDMSRKSGVSEESGLVRHLTDDIAYNNRMAVLYPEKNRTVRYEMKISKDIDTPDY